MSNYNPYAYTSTPSAPQPVPVVAGAPMPWDVGEVIGHAWTMFKPAWPTLVFSQVVSGIVGGVPNYVPAVLVATGSIQIHTTEYWTLYGVCMLIGLIVSTFFTGGMIKVWCAAARGQTPQFGDMFTGGRRFLPLLGMVVLTFLLVLPGYIALLVPGIIVALGLGFSAFYLVDQNMGPIEAMKASWRATTGHKGKLFVFGLVAVLMVVAGYVACCVGVFVTLPIVTVAWATIYTRLSGTIGTRFDVMPPPPGGTYGGGYGPPGYGPPGGPSGYGPPGGYGGPPGYGPPPPAGGFGGPPR